MNIKHKFECDNKEKIERSLGKFCTRKDSKFILTTILKERLPTRGDLARRERLLECVALVCVWCLEILEVEDHLFVGNVWYYIFRLVGTIFFFFW